MRRSKYQPEWGEPHLLSFVTDGSGAYVAVHADLAGISMLIDELEGIREQLAKSDCPHTHLLANVPNAELTTTKLNSPEEANVVQHVKIYGWTDEWCVKHGLKTIAE
jgi:hypothetical protein